MRHALRPHGLRTALGGLSLALVLTAATLVRPGLDPEVRRALDTLLLDEYRSEAEYQRVVDDLGAARPFSHLVRAERRHAEALLGLYARYDVALPANPYRAATSPSYTTLPEACAGGVASERANAALYDDALALDLPDDVRGVLEHNRMATVEHHLPAFERCGAGGGGPHGDAMGPGPNHGADCPHHGASDGERCDAACPRR